jgi:hypothetical protein
MRRELVPPSARSRGRGGPAADPDLCALHQTSQRLPGPSAQWGLGAFGRSGARWCSSLPRCITTTAAARRRAAPDESVAAARRAAASSQGRHVRAGCWPAAAWSRWLRAGFGFGFGSWCCFRSRSQTAPESVDYCSGANSARSMGACRGRKAALGL